MELSSETPITKVEKIDIKEENSNWIENNSLEPIFCSDIYQCQTEPDEIDIKNEILEDIADEEYHKPTDEITIKNEFLEAVADYKFDDFNISMKQKNCFKLDEKNKKLSKSFTNMAAQELYPHLSEELKRNPWQCKFCFYATDDNKLFEKHLPIHNAANALNASFDESLTYNYEKIKNTIDCFKCDHCSYSTSVKSSLRRHMKIHSGVKPFKCNNCNYAAAEKYKLKRHVQIHEKPFKCDQCSYSTFQINSLKNHLRLHSEEKPFKCDYCSYSFFDKSAVQKHLRIHNGERPFKCDHCSYATSDKSSLKKHLRIHSRERPYKCDHCFYAAIDSSALQKHLRCHSKEKPFKCDYCSYAANQFGSLKIHMRNHTGERPFKCKICTYAAIDKSKLQRHLRSHSSEKAFKCIYCSYAATQSSTLQRHLKMHRKKIFKYNLCPYTPSEKALLKAHQEVHNEDKMSSCCHQNISPNSSHYSKMNNNNNLDYSQEPLTFKKEPFGSFCCYHPHRPKKRQKKSDRISWTIEEKKVLLFCYSYSRFQGWNSQKRNVLKEQLQRANLPYEKRANIKKITSLLSQIHLYVSPEEIKRIKESALTKAKKDYYSYCTRNAILIIQYHK